MSVVSRLHLVEFGSVGPWSSSVRVGYGLLHLSSPHHPRRLLPGPPRRYRGPDGVGGPANFLFVEAEVKKKGLEFV